MNISATDRVGREVLCMNSLSEYINTGKCSKPDTFESSKKKDEKLTFWQKLKVKLKSKNTLKYIGIGTAAGVGTLTIVKLIKGIAKLFKHKK